MRQVDGINIEALCAAPPHQPTQAPCTPALAHMPPLSTLTSRATHAHPTSPRITGFCAIWDFISSSSSSPGSACPQPEPNATYVAAQLRPHLSASCTKTAAAVAWRGGEGARRPGPEGQVLRHVLWYVLRNVLRRVLHVLVLHVSSKGGLGGGSRPGRRAPQHTFLSPERLRSPRPLRARPSRVDRHCHWACRINKGFHTFAWRHDEET